MLSGWFISMEPVFYVNGEFLPQSRASLSVLDIGFLRGFGVFDFTITYEREPFRLRDHLERLRNSAGIIGLDLPWSLEELKALVYETLDRNPEGEQGIRIIVTGGESPDSLSLSGQPSLVIIVKPLRAYPREFFTKGIRVITFPARREIPEAKTLNYIHAIRALKQAKMKGAEDAIYSWGGALYECTACSLFAVKDGKIITAGRGVLDGITRRTVLELIRDRIPIEYRFIRTSEISSLDEAFLTSSSHEVMPITVIDDIRIGDGKPGPVTREVMRLFGEYTGKELPHEP
ncbi:MAG: aminotransferase class IV [Candidatus Bathyarchaeia archaeon]|nr:aminotransferase class IV [Candidatus Bathyarchaeota archaeon]